MVGSLMVQFARFWLKKNLTEINHKVSVIAKWFRRVIAAVFAVKCAGAAQNPDRSAIVAEAVMQDAFVGSWAQESHLSAGNLRSLRDLNHRFLDLAAARHASWAGRGGWRRCPPAQRAAAAGCPYALFDLRFQDDGYWRTRLQNSGAWRVADESGADDDDGGASCAWRCSMPGTSPRAPASRLSCCSA